MTKMDERKIAAKASKMRAMTDKELAMYVECRVEKARDEGYNKGKADAQKALAKKIKEDAK